MSRFFLCNFFISLSLPLGKLSPCGWLSHGTMETVNPVQPPTQTIAQVILNFFPVNIVDSTRVRVLIESSDETGRSWGTVGVSCNVIEASWQALVDSINFKLMKDEQQGMLPRSAA